MSVDSENEAKIAAERVGVAVAEGSGDAPSTPPAAAASIPDTDAPVETAEEALDPAAKKAAARAALMRSRAAKASNRSVSSSDSKKTDVRARALQSHQMMQAWGKKKRGPRKENQFDKIERNEAEAYALDLAMRFYMEKCREANGGEDVARCVISADDTAKIRAAVMSLLEDKLDEIMKEFEFELPDPEWVKKQEEEKLKAQAEAAAKELEEEEALAKAAEDAEKEEGFEVPKEPNSDSIAENVAVEDEVKSADALAASEVKEKVDAEGLHRGKTVESLEVLPRKAALVKDGGDSTRPLSDRSPKHSLPDPQPSLAKVTDASGCDTSAKEANSDAKSDAPGATEISSPIGSVEESAGTEQVLGRDIETKEVKSEESGVTDGDEAPRSSLSDDSDRSAAVVEKKLSKERRKEKKEKKKKDKDKKEKKKKDKTEESKEDETDLSSSEILEVKKKSRRKDSSDPLLRDNSRSSSRIKMKRKRSRHMSTGAIGSVLTGLSEVVEGRGSRKLEKKKKDGRREVSEGGDASDVSSIISDGELKTHAKEVKKKHRFPGAGSLEKLLKKSNSKLDATAPETSDDDDRKTEEKLKRKGSRILRSSDKRSKQKKAEEEAKKTEGSPKKKGSFVRPTLSRSGTSTGSATRGRNRARGAGGRPMLTRGGVGVAMSGPKTPTIIEKKNMVDVEKLNELLKETVDATFPSVDTKALEAVCPHDKGELDYYFLSLQGPRAANEDEYCVVEHVNEYLGLPEDSPNYSFFGVYDGHSGKYGSIFTRSQLISNIFRHPEFHSDVNKAFVDAFLLTDKLINDNEEKEKFDCGTTAISCCIKDHKELLISNVGDCEGFTCRAGKPVRMAVAHRPSDESEKARIKALGGAVVWFGTWRVNGMLAVSRSLGDCGVKNLVIAQPDTSLLEVTDEDEFLVCASDGIWDVLDFPTAIEIVLKTLKEKKGRRAACKEICEEALRRGTKDNVTVVVIFFQKEIAGLSYEEQMGVC